MKAKDSTQAGLARALGVSKQRVNKWATKVRYPREETAARIASALNVSADYLLGYSDKL